MTHNELAASLAGHLTGDGRMVWCDLQLGPSPSPRPDVYTIDKSYRNPKPTAYECKVSVSDFRADVTAGKWHAYRRFAGAIYFAVPAGLVSPSDVPDGCGLYTVRDGVWRAARKAVRQTVEIPQDTWLKLLIDGVARTHRSETRRRAFLTNQERAKRFGEVAARVICDRLAVEDEIDDARQSAERILDAARAKADSIRREAEQSIEPGRRELCALLGLPETSVAWTIARALDAVRRAQAEHPSAEAHRRMTTALRRALEQYGYTPADAENDVSAAPRAAV